jgi:thiol-disulfide isomerase/thioredoxin
MCSNILLQFEPRQVHAPEIGPEWLNSPPITMRGLRGRVVLIDFWDYTCVNCIRTLPYVREWHRRYRSTGLAVIGVHAPEFFFAQTAENVAKATEEFHLEYPILLDNDYQVWKAFANRYWPAKYLIDQDGYLRYFHAGEGNYEETEQMIQALLREIDPAVELPPVLEPVRALDRSGALEVCERPTPELYLGYQRGHIVNPDGFIKDQIASYQFGTQPPADGPELAGPWFAGAQFVAVAAHPTDGEPARLRLPYSAAEINLVMAPGTNPFPSRAEITDDGRPLDHQSRGEDVREQADGSTWIEIGRPRMYSVVKRDRFLSRELRLASRSTGLQLFAFTFVSCVPRP